MSKIKLEIKLGSWAKDRITGFKGIVMGFCTYLTGCDQYLIQPVNKEDSTEKPTACWLDVKRLEVTEEEIISLNAGTVTQKREPKNGCDIPAPTK